MKDRIKKDKEFIKEKCSKCNNKKTDLCEIRENIDKKLQCIYMKLTETYGNNFKFERVEK